ncbi:hypothetical protein A8B75_16810 [Sphingomonadales bacterium EhC05]|nr:hypothetical protein A8B75_16810 [Sphingomonadales bacterium EhC05]PHR18022.1 MAG: hypothetical protein COA41_10825 [Sphingopyxis sp.]
MHWRAISLAVFLIFSPVSALQAHEAHRNNEPDPVAQSNEHNAADESMASMQSGDMTDPHAEHAHKAATDKSFDLIDFLGRLHPMAVHFPIALFLVAALAELIMIINPTAGVGSSVRFLVWIGAAGGIVAAILGWLAGGIRMSDRSEILGLHRWTGTGIAITGILLALLSNAPANSGKRTVFRVGLAAVALAILFQGYWGAEMSLGPNHMGM